MTIYIPITDLETKVRELYLEGKIIDIGIDYEPNAIVGYFKKNGLYEEIEVFNFSKICKMDNRFSSYKLFQNKMEIVIEIVG